jgi:hypothetical protein
MFCTANSNLGVFEPGSKAFGKRYAEWSTEWYKWVLSIPKENNPVLDNTGENCAHKQNGSVWFLAGTIGGQAKRRCTIPAEKGVLFPIVVKECSFAEDRDLNTESELSARAKEDIDHVIYMETEIDGTKVKDLGNYRVSSGLFNLIFPQSNIYDVEPGPTQAVCNGYWILLKPLPQGRHTIHFGAGVYVQEGSVLAEQSKRYNRMDGNLFKTEVTYEITVKS